MIRAATRTPRCADRSCEPAENAAKQCAVEEFAPDPGSKTKTSYARKSSTPARSLDEVRAITKA